MATRARNPGRLTPALADRYRIERDLDQGARATVCCAESRDGSRAEARARPSHGALKGAHALASRCLAEPALQSGTPIAPEAAT
jgi:hypothetical protein